MPRGFYNGKCACSAGITCPVGAPLSFRKKAVERTAGDTFPAPQKYAPMGWAQVSAIAKRSVVPKAMAFAYEVPGEPRSKLGALSRRQSKSRVH